MRCICAETPTTLVVQAAGHHRLSKYNKGGGNSSFGGVYFHIWCCSIWGSRMIYVGVSGKRLHRVGSWKWRNMSPSLNRILANHGAQRHTGIRYIRFCTYIHTQRLQYILVESICHGVSFIRKLSLGLGPVSQSQALLGSAAACSLTLAIQAHDPSAANTRLVICRLY